jgi:hypothetical protein
MCRPSTLIFHIRVDDRHMPAVVTIRLYGYIDTYTIKIENKHVNRRLKTGEFHVMSDCGRICLVDNLRIAKRKCNGQTRTTRSKLLLM